MPSGPSSEREIRVIRRTLAAGAATSVAAALLVPWGPAATAADDLREDLRSQEASPATSLSKGPVLDLASGPGERTYIVQLEDAAVPSAGLQRSQERAYASELRSEQADLTSSISRITGEAVTPLHTYTHALNGIAVELTRAEALRVSELPGIAAVTKDFTRQLTTDKGPEWIGAPTIWDGTNVPGDVGSKGEGVVVGILDSGLNPANPSFADVSADGYDHTNPLGAGNYLGMCSNTDADVKSSPRFVENWGCNDKVIGYYDFDVANNDDGNFDDDGHGSHTASTAAGNVVDATVYAAKGTDNEFSVTSRIKGVAPRANIIGYDVCDGACQGTSIVAAIDQAIKDGVDAINYSIGSASPSNPWIDADAAGFLNARAAGIHVATSAGNAGPGAATLGSPGDVPWMTTVGATTHDRKYVASVTDLASDAGAGPADIAGAGLSGPTDAVYPLVDAASINSNALCEAEKFPAGTDLTGKIILCDRGVTGRVQKGEVVAALDAEGMILANDEASGDSLNGDAHALPAAHITYDDGVALRQWMDSVTGEKAALSGSIADVKPENGDLMAAFSSRGPNRAVSMISPSVSAPGVDILAAYGADNEVVWQFVSGTSMASPHTAGALALLAAVQPDWTPAEAQSALMTTAVTDVTDSDGTPADWHDMGSGRIDLTKVAKAGVVLDEDEDGYLAADPAQGGDVRELNTASMADNDCLLECSWTRTFTGTATGVGTWDVSVTSASDDLTLTTDKATVAVTDGGDVSVTVDAVVSGDAATDEWLFGTLVLTPPAGSSAPAAHLPVGVLPSSGVLPESVDITTRRDAGSQPETGLRVIPAPDLQLDPSGLVPGTRKALSIPLDTTNANAFDGNGVHVENVTIGQGAKRFVAQLENPTAPDFDVYVGR
jgi:subtilisin family serine protease